MNVQEQSIILLNIIILTANCTFLSYLKFFYEFLKVKNFQIMNSRTFDINYKNHKKKNI